LGRQFTAEIAILKDHQLVTEGPYSVVRHPEYAASFLMSFGILTVLSSPGSWVRESGVLSTLPGEVVAVSLLVFWSMTLLCLAIRIPREDRVLKKEFGKQWVEWKARVSCKLVPKLY
ncbi:hypothetical protein K435DRAFT_704945, partial [Dendrothele bispora CBS 962.96]